MAIEFFHVQSYQYNGHTVLCVCLRINGLLVIYFTSDRCDFDSWIKPLRQQIPADNMLAIDHFASGLETGMPHCGTRVVTGWAAMAIISALQKYHELIGPNLAVAGWELAPNTLESNLYLTRQVMARLRMQGAEQMVRLNTPQDALYIFTGPRGYQVAIVYASEQVADLASTFDALASTFLSTIPLMQVMTELPRTSSRQMVVFGENPWIDEAAACLTCMWIRVSRIVGEMQR